MNGLALFAGIGGIDLGLKLAWPEYRTVCYVERDAYACGVLTARIRDGCLDDASIWDDVATFDGRPWAGCVDIVHGGFPCQDLSCAGKRAGLEGKRSGLWSEYARIIGEVRPQLVLVENVPGLLTARGAMDTVLGSLAALGYDAVWDCVPAAAIGTPHRRDRFWCLAYANGGGQQERAELDGAQTEDTPNGDTCRAHPYGCRDDVAYPKRPERRPPCAQGRHDQGRHDADSILQRQEVSGGPGTGSGVVANADSLATGCQPQTLHAGEPKSGGLRREVRHTERRGRDGNAWRWTGAVPQDGCWWATEPALGRVAHGVPHRVDRLRALGNAVVPAVVRRFLESIGAPR